MNSDDYINSTARLDALDTSGLADPASVQAFDHLTRAAARATGSPLALISLVDATRQFFKSKGGDLSLIEGSETPLSKSVCKHVVRTRGPIIINDVDKGQLPADTDLSGTGIRSYAGVPLRTVEGEVLGALCVVDTHPRDWPDEQIDTLQELAAAIMSIVSADQESGSGTTPDRCAEALVSSVTALLGLRDEFDRKLRDAREPRAILELEREFSPRIQDCEGAVRRAHERVGSEPGDDRQECRDLADAVARYLAAEPRHSDLQRRFERREVGLMEVEQSGQALKQSTEDVRTALFRIRQAQEG